MSTTTTLKAPPFKLPLRIPEQGDRTGPAGAGKSATLSTIALSLTSHYDTNQKLVSTVDSIFAHPAETTEYSKGLRDCWYSILYESRQQRRGPTLADLHEQAFEMAYFECSKSSQDKLSRGKTAPGAAVELSTRMRPLLLSLITVEYSWKYELGADGLVPGLQVLGYERTTHKKICDTALTGTIDYTRHSPIRPDVQQIIVYRNTISRTMEELWWPKPVPKEIAHYVGVLPSSTPSPLASEEGSRQSKATHALLHRPRRASSSGTGTRAIAPHPTRRSQTGEHTSHAVAHDAIRRRTLAPAIGRAPSRRYSTSQQTVPAAHEGGSSVPGDRAVPAATAMLYAHLAQSHAEDAQPAVPATGDSWEGIIEDETLRLPPPPTMGAVLTDYGSQVQTYQDPISTGMGASYNADENQWVLPPPLAQPDYSLEQAAHSSAHGQYDNLATDTPQVAAAASQYNMLQHQPAYDQTYNNLVQRFSSGSAEDYQWSGRSETQ